ETRTVNRIVRQALRALPLAWLLLPAVAGAQILAPQEFAERRALLAERLGDGIVLGIGSAEPPQDYISFFQNSPFRYLTGFTEPNAALIMTVRSGEIESEILFVNPRDPAQETWEGYRVGPEGARMATGIEGRAVDRLAPTLDSLFAAGWTQVHV